MKKDQEIVKRIIDAVQGQPQLNASGIDLLLQRELENAPETPLTERLRSYHREVQESLGGPRQQNYNQYGILEDLRDLKRRFL